MTGTGKLAGTRRAIASVPGARWLWRRLRPRPTFEPFVEPVPVTRPADRGPAPEKNQAALADSYRLSALSREPDTFALYRIIGNDLPPRHTPGQSLGNLQFILRHEPPLPGCEKRFLLNRIVDARLEQAMIEQLEGAGVPYLRIPFDRDAYRRIGWDIEGLPLEYAPWSMRFRELSPGQRGRALMRLYRLKNNYVMNNNGARNAALHDGKALAKWVLPWDGNCFVTAAAWREITETVRAAPEHRYFIVPMARVTDNSTLLDPAARPQAREEPQILFRRDAALEFDADYEYGRRPKVNLLWRLGVPGDWDSWAIEPWDHPCPPFAQEAGEFAYAGWVARLFSGQAGLEATDEAGAIVADRGLARVEAIGGLLDRLDASVDMTASDQGRTRMIPEEAPGGRRDFAISDSLRLQLQVAADQALTRGPYSVVDKRSLPPSGNRHDYWHPAPYYWPHPLRIPGRPYVRRDGRRVPGTRLYEPRSDNYDRSRLQRLFDDTFVLALAWRYFGDQRYAEHAARLVRVWFLDDETAMNPHLEYAQVRRGHDGNKGSGRGIIEMKDLYYFLDGVRLLERAKYLSPPELDSFRLWMTRYLGWLRESPQGRSERSAGNNHGTYYDLQVAAIASYLGETAIIRATLRDSRSRLLSQFDSAGAQPEELDRSITAHYCCFNLQGWVHLATLAESLGEDLWSFKGRDGRGLRRGMEWLLAHSDGAWPYAQIDEFDAERFEPIGCAFARKFGARPGSGEERLARAAEIKPLFHPHDGIMPFWQLGNSVI